MQYVAITQIGHIFCVALLYICYQVDSTKGHGLLYSWGSRKPSFFCLDCIQMNTWHSWGLYIFLTIVHPVCVVIADRMDSDPVPQIDLVGILIPIAIVSYIWTTNNDFLEFDQNTLLLLGYLIVSFLASLRDDTSTYLCISMASILYIYFLTNHYADAVIIIAGTSTIMGGISHYLYKSRITAILAYSMGENKRMIAKYNNLVENYNQAVDYLNNLSSYSSSSYRGNEESAFEKGIQSGIGNAIVRGGFEKLSAFFGG